MIWSPLQPILRVPAVALSLAEIPEWWSTKRVITYAHPITNRKSRLTVFGVAGYVVLATVITYMASVRSG